MTKSTCWIDTVDQQQAEPQLKTIYDRVRGPGGSLDNLYQGFSLRPHTILPADDLYLAAMHHDENTLPKWFSELIGTYVAILTGCSYAQAHHGANYSYLMGDTAHSRQVLQGLSKDDPSACGEEKETCALTYVRALTLEPESMTESHIEQMKEQGWQDGEILEIVQVVAMFSYFVRVINAIGISLEDKKPGLY